LHATRVRIWSSSRFQADYLTKIGKQILENAVAAEKKAANKPRTKAPRPKKDVNKPASLESGVVVEVAGWHLLCLSRCCQTEKKQGTKRARLALSAGPILHICATSCGLPQRRYWRRRRHKEAEEDELPLAQARAAAGSGRAVATSALVAGSNLNPRKGIPFRVEALEDSRGDNTKPLGKKMSGRTIGLKQLVNLLQNRKDKKEKKRKRRRSQRVKPDPDGSGGGESSSEYGSTQRAAAGDPTQTKRGARPTPTFHPKRH
jgi:hypothetical protein